MPKARARLHEKLAVDDLALLALGQIVQTRDEIFYRRCARSADHAQL